MQQRQSADAKTIKGPLAEKALQRLDASRKDNHYHLFVMEAQIHFRQLC